MILIHCEIIFAKVIQNDKVYWKLDFSFSWNHGSPHFRPLRAGEVIIGDGSYSQTLEQRGYVQANIWTPEASVEHPEAVRQLAMEFARAGADITQTYTFYSDDEKLKSRLGPEGPTCHQINQSSSNIAKEVSKMKSTITAGHSLWKSQKKSHSTLRAKRLAS